MLYPIFWFIDQLLSLYALVVFIYVVLGWLEAMNVVDRRNGLVAGIMDFCYRVTEPVLRQIRRVVPVFGGLDISPLILLLLIMVVRMYVARLGIWLG